MSDTSCKHSMQKFACENLTFSTKTGELAFQFAIGKILFQNKML